MGPRWRPVFIFLSLVNACLSELFVFNPVTFEPPNVLRPPVAELEYTPTQAVPVNDVNELGVSPQEAAEAFTGSQHALTSVVLASQQRHSDQPCFAKKNRTLVEQTLLKACPKVYLR